MARAFSGLLTLPMQEFYHDGFIGFIKGAGKGGQGPPHRSGGYWGNGHPHQGQGGGGEALPHGV